MCWRWTAGHTDAVKAGISDGWPTGLTSRAGPGESNPSIPEPALCYTGIHGRCDRDDGIGGTNPCFGCRCVVKIAVIRLCTTNLAHRGVGCSTSLRFP
jgi:hypothetical protein